MKNGFMGNALSLNSNLCTVKYTSFSLTTAKHVKYQIRNLILKTQKKLLG